MWADQNRLEQFKRDLRVSFRQRSELFRAFESAHYMERLNEHLIEFMRMQNGTWAAFQANGHEPRLDKVFRSSSHIRWVFPKSRVSTLETVAPATELEFRYAQKFAKGTYGIEEPVDGDLVSLTDIKGFLVPGVAFDREGRRLGRGKGYYDKALAASPGLRIGVGFCFQIYEGLLPEQAFDMKMDALITDQGFWATGATSERA